MGNNVLSVKNFRKPKTNDANGYVLIYSPSHPNSRKSGYVLEHRIIVENNINRYLEKHEIIHHKNKIVNDNRIENLENTSHSKHFTHHNTKDLSGRKCSNCGSNKTYMRKLKTEFRPCWRSHNGNTICHKCYCNIWNKNKRALRSPSLFE